tara:strand:+ start:1699 stop:2718 length:1020 start_codon:yes stop_codon:yes gene_type:complete
MKILDSQFEFRLGKKREIPLIMKFIKNYWKKKHILGLDKKFFEYEFVFKNRVNFMLGLNKKNKELVSIQGFIPYSISKKYLHICGSITLTKPDIKIPFLGIETMKRMLKFTKPFSYCGIGIDPVTMKPLVEKFFNRYTGTMSHFYYLNPNIKKFKIAKIEKKFRTSLSRENIFYEEISDFNYLKKKIKFNKKLKNLPMKSGKYIEKRYFKHPKYNYKFFVIENENVLIAREVYLKKYKRKILSLVDYIGNVNKLGKINNLLNSLISKQDYEYIDLLCTNNISKILIKSGFKLKSLKDKNIIPVYFSPFVKKNVNIYYETSDKKMLFFKADADQDRPNKK